MKPRLREVKQPAQGHTAFRGKSKQSTPQPLLLTSLYASASYLRRVLKSNFHFSGCSSIAWYRFSVENGAQVRSATPCSDMLNATGSTFLEHLLRDRYPAT